MKYGTNAVGILKNSPNTLILSGGHTSGNLALQANSGVIQINQDTNLAGIIKSDMAGSEFVVSGATGNNLVLGSNDTLIQFDITPLSDNPNESYTRSPDLTGEFDQHSNINSLLFSPGTKIDGSPF